MYGSINLLVDSMYILDELSQWEKDEINILDGIWFVGNASNDKIQQASNETDFDGEKGRFKWKLGNHINYRFDLGGSYCMTHTLDSTIGLNVLLCVSGNIKIQSVCDGQTVTPYILSSDKSNALCMLRTLTLDILFRDAFF